MRRNRTDSRSGGNRPRRYERIRRVPSVHLDHVRERQRETHGSSFLGTLENVIKIGATGLVFVAAMGFPAVYLLFRRFHIPTDFMSYNQVLRAGVLPAIALAAVAAYVYLAAKGFRARKSSLESLTVVGLGCVPVVILGMLLGIAGTVSGSILLVWSLQRVSFLSSSTQKILEPSGPIILVSITLTLSVILLLLIALVTRGRWANRKGWFWSLLRLLVVRSLDKRLQDGTTRCEPEYESDRARNRSRKQVKLWRFPLLILYFITSLYLVKGALYVLKSNLFAAMRHEFILLIGFGLGFIMVTFEVILVCEQWLKDKDRSVKKRGVITMIFIVIFYYLISVLIYSYVLYPRLPYMLGGGKPTPVVLWLDKETIPSSLQTRLLRANFRVDGSALYCEGLYLVHKDSEKLILADSSSPPASVVLLAKDKIKAMSW